MPVPQDGGDGTIQVSGAICGDFALLRVLVTTTGQWLSITILTVSTGLFLHLLQSVFQPPKVREKVKNGGPLLHDPDAVHGKHGSAVMHSEAAGGRP